MSGNTDFLQLIARLREGDEAAAQEIVTLYEPVIRGTVRPRLRDARFRRLFDSNDITQSALASFFVRANAGQFDLNSPAQLGKLLNVMVQNKLAERIRHETAQRRDARRLSNETADEIPLPDGHIPEHESLEIRELINRAQSKMTDEENAIAGFRRQGMNWEQIAEKIGGSPDGRRKQLARAVSRIVISLGLEP